MTTNEIQKYMENGRGSNLVLPELDEALRGRIPRTTLRYWLTRFLKLEYAYTKKKGVFMKGEARHLRIRKFVIEFYRALKLQENEDYIVVFSDESYINTNHSPLQSWHAVDGHHSTEKTTSKGKRLIVLHAITREGFLTTLDVETAYPVEEPPLNSPKVPLETAEWIWPANSKHKVSPGVRSFSCLSVITTVHSLSLSLSLVRTIIKTWTLQATPGG